jgi:methyl-accepting chemotaxis protein
VGVKQDSTAASTPPSAPPSSGAFDGLRALSARAVRRALKELEGWAVRNVTTVNELSGREVLAVGTSLDAIVREVRTQTVETQSAMAALTANDDTSVASAIASQSQAITEHTTSVQSTLTKQAELADAAMSSLRNITAMAQRVSKMAQSMRMLSLNARVEAARLGTGSVVTVIAQEMTTMTNEVRVANTEIEQVVRDLEQALPQIARQAHAARDQSTSFMNVMQGHMDRVDGAVTVLRDGVSAALRSSDERLGTVLSVSQTALSHLQFQDTAAQALQRIERDVAQVSELLAVHLETGDLESLEFLSQLKASSSNRERAAGEIVLLDDPAGHAESGGIQGGQLVFL